jgi:phospholipase/carboxylesterase
LFFNVFCAVIEHRASYNAALDHRELYTIVRPALSPSEGKPPLLVLLHGLGSNEEDLMSFAPMLDPKLTVAAVRAPHRYNWGGYAWFEVAFGPSGPESNETQVEASLTQLVDYLRSLPDRLGTDPARTILGGFSQGAMMSLGVALREPSLARKLLLLSGLLMPSFQSAAQGSGVSLGGAEAFVTHGTHDPLLPASEGRRMAEFMRSLGADVDFREYPMAHEVSQQCLRDVAEWLRGAGVGQRADLHP